MESGTMRHDTDRIVYRSPCILYRYTIIQQNPSKGVMWY